MIENRELGMEDYLAMLKRRIKVILIPTLLLPVVGFAVSFAFAPKYTSQATVLVEEQRVPEGYVKPVVTEDINQRIATLQNKALGADRLRPLIERLQLAQGGRSVDSVIDEIRENMAIVPVQVSNVAAPIGGRKAKPGDVPGFNVAYTAKSPREAQELCAGLTDIILKENVSDRTQVAQSTTDFLSRQLEDAKHNLDDLDSRLANFKRQYIGQLPGDTDNNLKVLMGMNSQLDSNTQTLNRAQQDRAYTESLLAQQLATWKSSQTSTNPQTMQQQLAQLQSQLVTLQARYTDDYPDVVKTKRDIAQLQKQLDNMNSAAATAAPVSTAQENAVEPPEIQQLRMQLHQYQQVITQATRDQQKLQEQIRLYQGRVALSPAVEEQYKQLTRDYATAQKIYDDMLSKKSQAEMQTAMEREQQGEQMRLLIPADSPDTPSFPNRIMFAGGGFGGGLVLGVSLAMLLEMRDKSLRTEADVIAALDLPVLSQVPWVGAEAEDGDSHRKRKVPLKSEAAENNVERVEV
jgi:polysaccharide chain length determinant protein (PEP-CTERM system associated)